MSQLIQQQKAPQGEARRSPWCSICGHIRHQGNCNYKTRPCSCNGEFLVKSK